MNTRRFEFTHVMVILWILVGGTTLCTAHDVYFANLDVDVKDAQVSIDIGLEVLGSSDFLRNHQHPLKQTEFLDPQKAKFEQIFDVIPREALAPATDDRSDQKEFRIFLFELQVRDIQGNALHRVQNEVVYAISAGRIEAFWGPNVFSLSPEHDGYARFDRVVDSKERLLRFLSQSMMPQDSLAFPLPDVAEFVVDLKWKSSGDQAFDSLKAISPNGRERRFREIAKQSDVGLDPTQVRTELAPGAITHESTKIDATPSFSTRYPFPAFGHALGSTYCTRRDGQWTCIPSAYFKRYRQAVKAHQRQRAMANRGHTEGQVEALEDYLDLVPNDARAWAKLGSLLIAMNREESAHAITQDYGLFFSTQSKVRVRNLVSQKTQLLLGKTAHFSEEPNQTIDLISPKPGDIVAGTTLAKFRMTDRQDELLRVDGFLNSEVIGSLTHPPYELPFSVHGLQGQVQLTLRAFFRDQTFQQLKIPIRVISVDEETQVTLVALRAVVIDENRFITDLTKEDFVLEVRGKPVPINRFGADTSPLKIVILLDNSFSMQGDRIYRAQYAVRNLLTQLRPTDQASVFAFDNKVLKLSDFSQQTEQLIPTLYTMDPRGLTALSDGLLVAFNQVKNQNGTKVIIVVSDGQDTFSLAEYEDVKDRIVDSDVMVYAITLGSQNRNLKNLARATGSVYTELDKTENLPAALARVYEELRSFYYLDFGSNASRHHLEKLKLTVTGDRGRARFKTLTRR